MDFAKTRSPPTRRRGSKLLDQVRHVDRERVASHAEAWIETSSTAAARSFRSGRLPCGGADRNAADDETVVVEFADVASRAEARIETISSSPTGGCREVASRAEAWIETSPAAPRRSGRRSSPPVRRRGSKHGILVRGDEIGRVASRAEAWIETCRASQTSRPGRSWSPPARRRGSKLGVYGRDELPANRRLPRGGVDRNGHRYGNGFRGRDRRLPRGGVDRNTPEICASGSMGSRLPRGGVDRNRRGMHDRINLRAVASRAEARIETCSPSPASSPAACRLPRGAGIEEMARPV